jgi:hypothetical protein
MRAAPPPRPGPLPPPARPAALLVLPVLLALAAGAPRPARAAALTPWQGSASLAVGLGEGPTQGASFFLGHAWGLGASAHHPLPFLALGGELTLAGPRTTYDTALGPQLRAGVAFPRPVGPGEMWPELLLFARAAPFLASVHTPLALREQGVRLPPAIGVRVGVGVTAAAWTGLLLREAFPEEPVGDGGALAEAARVVTGLVLLPLAFLNHVELSAELSEPRGGGPRTRSLAIRVGSGF